MMYIYIIRYFPYFSLWDKNFLKNAHWKAQLSQISKMYHMTMFRYKFFAKRIKRRQSAGLQFQNIAADEEPFFLDPHSN